MHANIYELKECYLALAFLLAFLVAAFLAFTIFFVAVAGESGVPSGAVTSAEYVPPR